jgi:hypothetical protein
MACPVCASLNPQTKASIEMVVHFSGFKLRGHPGVPLISPLSVCLDCGFAGFTISKPNLDLLQVGLESDEGWANGDMIPPECVKD